MKLFIEQRKRQVNGKERKTKYIKFKLNYNLFLLFTSLLSSYKLRKSQKNAFKKWILSFFLQFQFFFFRKLKMLQ